ncbi:ATP-dependent RNA helicase ROK1, partial [Magnaporthiopsis poae ATCC 64411]
MDILKVLSRGTKLSSKRPTAAARANLPSAGVETNPQLYHDVVGPAPGPKGTKRKRKTCEKGDGRRVQQGADGEMEEEKEEDELSDIDFFAPKNRPGQSDDAASGKAAKDGADKTKKNKKQKKGDSDALAADPLELDECKRIMRSHRLKFTLSQLHQPLKESAASKLEAEEDVKKKEKRKKLGKGEEEATAAAVESSFRSDEKKQIYPQPLVSFSELRHTYRISPRLADNLARDGYKVPTEVQLGSLPLLLRPDFALSRCENAAKEATEGGGVHFLAVAPTGSGKTLSFLIPAINGVLKRRAERGGGGGEGIDRHALEAIVVAPTRELASQIANEGRKLAMGTGVRVVLMRKGMRVAAAVAGGSESADGDDLFESEAESSSGDEDEQGEGGSRLKKAGVETRNPTKADILVTTPMHLLNFLSEGGSSKMLPNVRSLILDEADVLLDPLFRDQTAGIWSACRNPELRVTFWSATMPSSIEALMFDRLRAHHSESSSSSSRTAAPPLVRLVVGLKDTAVPNIAHRLTYTATEAGKLLAIRQLLHPSSFSSSSSSSAEGGGGAADAPLRPPFL